MQRLSQSTTSWHNSDLWSKLPYLLSLPLTPKRNNLTRTFLTKWLPTCTLLALFILGWVLFTLIPRWIIQFLRIPYRPTGTHKVFLLSQGRSCSVNRTIYFIFLWLSAELFLKALNIDYDQLHVYNHDTSLIVLCWSAVELIGSRTCVHKVSKAIRTL